MSSNPVSIQADLRAGLFNYLKSSVNSSLYRNGKVLTRRDPDGSDGGTEGVDLDLLEKKVANARLLEPHNSRTLRAHGFELLDQPIGGQRPDFFKHEEVLKHYYPHCAEVVSAATGGKAYAFDHNVRSASGKSSKKRIDGGQQVQGPAHVVHGDYTLYSAPQRLRDLSKPPGGNDTLSAILGADQSLISPDAVSAALESNGRFAIINVWRNIAAEPVMTHPIALCDGQTVKPEDLVVFEIHYQDRIGENYFAKHAPQHGWYFYPEMTGEEALLIKQWDSSGALARSDGKHGDGSAMDQPCTFSFHSAFEDPATPDNAPDRWSIEVRCIVLFD